MVMIVNKFILKKINKIRLVFNNFRFILNFLKPFFYLNEMFSLKKKRDFYMLMKNASLCG